MYHQFETEARQCILAKCGNALSSFSHFAFSEEGHIGQRFFLGIAALVSLSLSLLSLLYTRDNIALKKQFKRTWNVLSPYSVLYDLQKRIFIRISFLRKPGSTCEILYICTFAMWLSTSFKYVRQFCLLLTILESLTSYFVPFLQYTLFHIYQ